MARKKDEVSTREEVRAILSEHFPRAILYNFVQMANCGHVKKWMLKEGNFPIVQPWDGLILLGRETDVPGTVEVAVIFVGKNSHSRRYIGEACKTFATPFNLALEQTPDILNAHLLTQAVDHGRLCTKLSDKRRGHIPFSEATQLVFAGAQ